MRIFWLILLLWSIPLHVNAKVVWQPINQLPLLHEGRIKPIDSFARLFLQDIRGNQKDASQWLTTLLFDPQQAYKEAVFFVHHPEIITLLSLPKRKGSRYSFLELSTAYIPHLDMLNQLIETEITTLSDTQQQLVTLYHQTIQYYELSRSLMPILPLFKLENKTLAQKLELPHDTPLTYLDIIQKKPFLTQALEDLQKKQHDIPLSTTEQQLLKFVTPLAAFTNGEQLPLLTIIPSSWDNSWVTLYQLLHEGKGSPQTATLLRYYQDAALAYHNQDITSWNYAITHIQQFTHQLAKDQFHPFTLTLEYYYHRLQLLPLTLGLYLITLLLTILYSYRHHVWLHHLALSSLCLGTVIHFCTIALRVIILSRPPIGTLYESIISVALVVTGVSTLIALKKHESFGLWMGSITGSLLLLIASQFAKGGDTMNVLVAVLNTNFWLTVHVITIIIGYGCCIIASMLAHLIVIQSCCQLPNQNKILKQQHSLFIATVIALTFTLIGTILGGIWADQSWGRFWGWDPKENGALLIILWLLFLLHGKVGNILSPTIFTIFVAATSIPVALAWFGVNLLSVGLHSYGFTDNILMNLVLFIAFELGFMLISYSIVRRKNAHAIQTPNTR